MNNKDFITLNDLIKGTRISLFGNSYVESNVFNDAFGSDITILSIYNGLLTFSVLLERGMDIGEIFYGSEKISWERDTKYLLHPNNVNLNDDDGTGWLKGFYAAVASIGPEIFGTPGEGYTLHGTSSYSLTNHDSVRIYYDCEEILVEGIVSIKGYDKGHVFEKKIMILTKYGSPVLLREERTKNTSDNAQVLDDGFHIQLSGQFMSQGGCYVLPVKKSLLLLRDSAPKESDPLYISPVNCGNQPLRCYQYIPGIVNGLNDIDEIKRCLCLLKSKTGLTAEMIINDQKNTAAYIIRPLHCFPRSLIAKEIDNRTMFCFEPCRTRPNRMSQKIIDGEAFYLQPDSSAISRLLIGVSKNQKTITAMEKAILKAAESL